MNPNTLAELKALHKSIGDLILAQEVDDSHHKIKTLVGRCYMRSDKTALTADKITCVIINRDLQDLRRVQIHSERLRCIQSDGETTSYIYDDVTNYSVHEALLMVEGKHQAWKESDIIAVSKFNRLKSVIEDRSKRLIEDVMEVSAE